MIRVRNKAELLLGVLSFVGLFDGELSCSTVPTLLKDVVLTHIEHSLLVLLILIKVLKSNWILSNLRLVLAVELAILSFDAVLGALSNSVRAFACSEASWDFCFIVEARRR
jgi:hypothetical protein